MKLCGFNAGLGHPFFLIAGPCVIESEQLQMDTAGTLRDITRALGIPFIFKSSFDKANRTSGTSFRGPGLPRLSVMRASQPAGGGDVAHSGGCIAVSNIALHKLCNNFWLT